VVVDLLSKRAGLLFQSNNLEEETVTNRLIRQIPT